MMKKILLAAALLASTSGVLAEVSGNVALSSDYRFRGISQTDRDPAISGGFDYAHESGLYAGVWASNIQFAGSIEMDYYAGFGGDLTEDVAYDVGIIYYDYPSDNAGAGPDLEFVEIYGGLSTSLGAVDLGGTLSISDDYFGESGSSYYIDLGASTGLASDITLSGHYGFQSIDDGAASKAGFFSSEEDDYMDWSIGVSKSMGGVDLDLSYLDTNLSSSDCFSSDICDSTVIFTVSKSL